jgi:hypothetical protein
MTIKEFYNPHETMYSPSQSLVGASSAKDALQVQGDTGTCHRNDFSS